MTSRRMRILKLLAAGAITPEEADQLLSTLSQVENGSSPALLKRAPKQICVKITNDGKRRSKQKINLHAKVPIAVLKTGIRLTSLLPAQGLDALQSALDAKGLGIDLKALSSGEQFEELIRRLDIDSMDKNGNHVRIYSE